MCKHSYPSTQALARANVFRSDTQSVVQYRLSHNAYPIRLTRFVFCRERDVKLYSERARYKRKIHMIRARLAWFAEIDFVEIEETSDVTFWWKPKYLNITKIHMSLDFLKSTFSLFVRTLLIINMEIFHIANIDSVRINSKLPYKYSSLHVRI